MKIKLSKSQWESLGKIKKEAMADWLPQDIKQRMIGDNWLVDMLGDRVPPEVGIEKLRGIDPNVALNMTKIYNFDPEKDVKKIDGRLYLITDIGKPLKKKQSFIKALDIQTGEIKMFDRETTLPLIEEQALKVSEKGMNKINAEIKLHNERIDAIDKATSNITLLPLQLDRASRLITQRIETLDAIIAHFQTKMQQPKPQSIQDWETGREQAIKGGGLGEIDFIDSVMNHYKYKYDKLVEDLNNGTLQVPQNLPNAEEIKKRLIDMGQLSFDEYQKSLEDRRKPAGPGVPFDINQVDVGKINELTLEDVPSKTKSTGYQNFDASGKSSNAAIIGSQKNKADLEKINAALIAQGQKLGALGSDERSNEAIKNTPEGQAIIKGLEEFANNELGEFVRRYKNEVVDSSGNIDTKKMGRAGQVGNALIVVTLSRLYKVIHTIINKFKGPDAPIEMEQERAQEPAPEGIQENAKDTRNMMEKLSGALWDAFDNRMKPSR